MPSFLQYAGAGLLGGASQVATDIGEAGLKAKEEEKKRKAAAEGQRLKHMYELQKLGVQHELARKNIAYEQGLKDERFAAKQQLKGYDDYLASETAAKQAELDREHEKEIQGMKGEQRIGLEEKKGDKKLEQIIVKSNLTRDRKVELFNMSSNLKMLMNSNDNRTKLMANELNNLAKIYIARHGNLSEERIEKMKDLTKRLGIKFDFDIAKYKADAGLEGKKATAASRLAVQTLRNKGDIDVAKLKAESSMSETEAKIEADKWGIEYNAEAKKDLERLTFLNKLTYEAERQGNTKEIEALRSERAQIIARIRAGASKYAADRGLEGRQASAQANRDVANIKAASALAVRTLTNMGQIDVQKLKNESTMSVAQAKIEADKWGIEYNTDAKKDLENLKFNNSLIREAERHGNTKEIEALRSERAQIIARIRAGASMYAADRGLEGRKISAEAGVQRSWMAAQSVLKKIESSERIAKWNNEAKVGIARLNADTRIDIANMVKETTLTANQARIEAKERNLVYDRETKELLQAEGFLSASILQAERFGYQAEAASLKAQRDIVLANLNNKAAQQRTETRTDAIRDVANIKSKTAVKLQGMRNLQRTVEKDAEFRQAFKMLDAKYLNKKSLMEIESELGQIEGKSAHERKMAQIKLKGKLAKELDDSKQKQNNERLNKTLANRENIVRLRISSVEKRDRRKLNLAYRKHGFDVRKMSHKTFADWALSASTTEDTSGQITGASGVTINLGGKRKGILDENLHSYLLQYGSDNDYIIPQPYEPTLREIWTGMIKKGYARSVQDMTPENYNKVFKALLTKHGRWIATKFRRPSESEFGAAALVANSQSQQPTPEQ